MFSVKMKFKQLSFLNCCTVLVCAFLIAFVIALTYSNIISVNKRHDIGGMANEQIFFPFYNKTKSEFFGNGVLKYTSKYLSALNDSTKSKTQPINQNVELNSSVVEKANKTKPNESETLLYRKRRYLLFPEGSSFQIVFDLIIPIIDYTNYAIMGITCAVAWELPSKAPSEIANELIDKLNDGTYGLSRNDSVTNIEYIDTPNHLKDGASHIIYIQPSEYAYQSSTDKKGYHRQEPTYYMNDFKNNKMNTIPRPIYHRNQEKLTIKDNSATRYNAPFKIKSINNERIDAGTWKGNYAKRPEGKPPVADNFPEPSKPAVYHIMGKRSIEPPNPWLEKLDRIHLSYHRSSRHSLYSKIEGMFNNRGKNGTECILRALCETGQRQHQREPGGLMAEILRAIFTLPKADHEMNTNEHHPKRKTWDEAYANRNKCSEMYPLCENFIWN